MPSNVLPFGATSTTWQAHATTTVSGVQGLNPIFGGKTSVLVTNVGPDMIFIDFNDTAITATVNVDCPILAADSLVVAIPVDCKAFSVICPTSTATIYLTAVDPE